MATEVPMRTRVEFLLSTSTKDSLILEVGPAHAPIAPKSQGWRTSIIDAQNAEELHQKFLGTGSNVDAIEEVDFVWHSGTIENTIPATLHGSFDTIIASHVIEHIPDLVRFFQSASKLVKSGGSIALAIPDYRFCFDCFKSPSTTADLISAYCQGAVRHTRRTIFDHIAYSALHNGAGAWGQHPVKDFSFMYSLQRAWQTVREIENENCGSYIDSHSWQFTPARFQLAILELRHLDLIDWHIEVLDRPVGCEFLVILRRDGLTAINEDSLDAARLSFLRESIEEAGVQARFMAASQGDFRTTLFSSSGLIEQLQQQMTGLTTSIARQAELLEVQALQLRQIAEVSSWQRKLLLPLHILWRRLRLP